MTPNKILLQDYLSPIGSYQNDLSLALGTSNETALPKESLVILL